MLTTSGFSILVMALYHFQAQCHIICFLPEANICEGPEYDKNINTLISANSFTNSMQHNDSVAGRVLLSLLLIHLHLLGSAAQLVTCLATDANLTADPGVTSLFPARSHTFVETDHEIISMVILLPSAESFMKGCCQLQVKVCAGITGLLLVQACPGKSVVR